MSARILAVLMLVGAALPAGTTDKAGHIRIELVADLTQAEGETEHLFLLRIARTIRQYTTRTNFEACATVCQSPDRRRSVLIFSGESQIWCPLLNACAIGTEPLPVVIHSHPIKREVVLNANDAQRLSGTFRRYKPGQRYWTAGSRFSSEDYALGPGYLVYGDALLQQEGKGSERFIEWIPR